MLKIIHFSVISVNFEIFLLSISEQIEFLTVYNWVVGPVFRGAVETSLFARQLFLTILFIHISSRLNLIAEQEPKVLCSKIRLGMQEYNISSEEI